MGTSEQRQHGFTLIEVMLFLGITSALAVGILASSSLAINQQRYQDATKSLQSLLQHQYNEASNVVNDRLSKTEKDRKCGNTGIKTILDDSINDPEDRGTSECLVMGRLTTLTNSKDITISSVVGYKPSSVVANEVDDIAALQQYTFFISKADVEKEEIAWSGTATIKDSLNTVIPQTNPLAILILRSPLTGLNHTFVFQNTSTTDQINSTDIAINKMVERKICIDPASFTISQGMGVIIRANASGASSIELSGDTGGC